MLKQVQHNVLGDFFETDIVHRKSSFRAQCNEAEKSIVKNINKKVPIFDRDLFGIEDILTILNKISKSYFLKYDVSVVTLYL